MYRELDKCTIYLLDKLKEIKNREKLLLNVIFYRFFNKFNLYEDLNIKPFEKITPTFKKQLIESFNNIKNKGLPIFNNAYLISGNKAEKKHITILNNLETLSGNINKIIELIDESKTPEESFNVLNKIPMSGPFLSCEFWTDLTYLNFFKQRWTDDDFVNIGPGAKWGLEILYNQKLNRSDQEKKLHHLSKIQEKMLDDVNNDIKWETIAYKNAFSNYPYLSLTNIEGALCEFRKYWNIKHGKGRRKFFNQENYLKDVKFS